MARVTIFGGHGKVALLAAPKLVQAGHQVTSVIRNDDQTFEVEATGATARVADIETLDVAQLTDLLADQDAVVFSAGAGGGDADRTFAVDRDAASRTMDASAAAGVGRYVMVSYMGASLQHGVPEDDDFYAYAQAKAEADAHLRESDLQWTILMPATLTLEPSQGTLELVPSGDTPDKAETSRDLVADVIAGVLAAPADQVAGKEVPFIDGATPITEALKTL